MDLAQVMTRQELLVKLGIIRIVDPIVERAYQLEEEKIWREDLGNAPHGEPWHTGFHCSSFPGDDEKACGRKAIYSLLNIPPAEPLPSKTRVIFDLGKHIEKDIVDRWASSGVLLSAETDSEFQTGFIDEEHWLTGATDAIVLPPGWKKPLPIEVKSTSDEKIEEMKNQIRSYSEQHRHQIMAYTGLAHEAAPILWPDLQPPDCGALFYASRENPRNTFEFMFDYDPDFMAQGRAKLAEWRDAFLEGRLPERPKDWKWTELPCKYCSAKRICKQDYKDKITDLIDSCAVEFASQIRPDYNYLSIREAVLRRWDAVDRSSSLLRTS